MSSSTKPANEKSVQADQAKTYGTTEVAGKPTVSALRVSPQPTMEEISARISAKLALLEASQQV